MHDDKSPLAGMTVRVNFGDKMPKYITGLHDMDVEDWWDHLTGGSWMWADGNPACMMYGMRSGFNSLPPDNEVLYGHETHGALGHLFHKSEIVGEQGNGNASGDFRRGIFETENEGEPS